MIRSVSYCRLMSYIIIVITSSHSLADRHLDDERARPGWTPGEAGIFDPDKPPLARASAR
jgi:hypothetical protein